MADLGDRVEDQPINFRFTTRRFSSGAPFTLAGTPSLAIYKDGGTTESTAGITLTVDFDAKTGLNNVAIVTTDAFYAAGSDYEVVIAAGTVDSVSVVNEVVARFSIENRSTEADVTSFNGVSLETGNGPIPELGITRFGTCTVNSATEVVLDAGAPFVDNAIIAQSLYIEGSTAGKFENRLVDAYVASTKTVTVKAYTDIATGARAYILFGTPQGSSANPLDVNLATINEVPVVGAGIEADKWRA